MIFPTNLYREHKNTPKKPLEFACENIFSRHFIYFPLSKRMSVIKFFSVKFRNIFFETLLTEIKRLFLQWIKKKKKHFRKRKCTAANKKNVEKFKARRNKMSISEKWINQDLFWNEVEESTNK